MTNAEKLARIDKLETERFYLSMKDHWTYSDFQLDRELVNELRKLKKETVA